MLIIRLRRSGKKNKPTYRIVVAEHSFPIDGRFVEDLGHYNPHNKTVGIDKEKAVEWMKKGARPSNSIAKIFEKEKIKHSSVVVVKKNKKSKSKEEAKPAAPAAAPATEQAAPTTDTSATEEAPAEETVPAEAGAEETEATA
jgi:small subunit ribosomal protein S16